jgi:RNA polymerase sigma-70 factor (ECF subfamily)
MGICNKCRELTLFKARMRMETNELVEKAKNGEEEAFGQLYDSFAQRIFKYIRLKVQNRQEAEDILQETFIKAYRGLSGLRPDDLNFNAWLYKIAGNTINDHFRKAYRTPDILSIDENFDLPSSQSLEKEIEVSSDMDNMRKTFAKLPPLYKQVLELRFLQEFSLDEIAKILNKSNLSVRLLQHRALKKVKIILDNNDF